MSLAHRAMDTRSFEDATASTARTLSRDHKIEVVFAGEMACTNNAQIILPKLPDNKTLSKEQVAIGRGYVDHEIGHKLMTDFAYGEKNKAVFMSDPLVKALSNAMEDVRIERGLGDLYPGMPENIVSTAQAVNTHFRDKVLPDHPDAMSEAEQILPIAITWEGRSRIYNEPVAKELLDKLDPAIRAKAKKFVDVVMSLPTGTEGGRLDTSKAHEGSRQVMDLAKAFAKEVRDDKEEEEKRPHPSGGSGGSGSGEDDGESDEGAEGSKASVGEVGSSAAEEQETKLEPFDPSLHPAYAELMSGTFSSRTWRPFSRQLDRIHHKHDQPNKYPDYRRSKSVNPSAKLNETGDPSIGEQRYANRLAMSSSRLGVMRRKLERALLAKTNIEYEGGFISGKLNLRSITKVVSGKPNVFKRKTEGQEIDTALTLLVDLSGSMSGPKIELAQDATIALSEALANTGIALEVLGFTAHSYRFPDRALHEAFAAADSRSVYTRMEAIDTYVFKEFDELLKDCRRQLGNMCNLNMGNNADGDSLLVAYDRLSKRKESRKILIVLSDGYPAFQGRMGNEHLKQVVNELSKKIEVVGIGIQSDAVERFYPKYQVLNDIEDLPKSVLDNIARLLLGERFRVDNADVNKAAA